MQIGDIIRARKIRAYGAGDGGWIDYSSNKTGNKFTHNFVFLVLGMEPVNRPLEDEDVHTALNNIGWRQMTDSEWEAFLEQKRNLVK